MQLSGDGNFVISSILVTEFATLFWGRKKSDSSSNLELLPGKKSGEVGYYYIYKLLNYVGMSATFFS